MFIILSFPISICHLSFVVKRGMNKQFVDRHFPVSYDDIFVL